MNRLTQAESARFRRRLLAHIDKGTARRELASWMGCARATVYNLLRSTARIRRCYATSMAKRLGTTPEDLYKSSKETKEAHGIPALLRNWKDATGQPTRRTRANQMAAYIAEFAVVLGAKADYLVETTTNNEPCKVTVWVTSRTNGLSSTLEVSLNHTRRGDVVLSYIDPDKHRIYSGKLSANAVRRLISKTL